MLCAVFVLPHTMWLSFSSSPFSLNLDLYGYLVAFSYSFQTTATSASILRFSVWTTWDCVCSFAVTLNEPPGFFQVRFPVSRVDTTSRWSDSIDILIKNTKVDPNFALFWAKKHRLCSFWTAFYALSFILVSPPSSSTRWAAVQTRSHFGSSCSVLCVSAPIYKLIIVYLWVCAAYLR